MSSRGRGLNLKHGKATRSTQDVKFIQFQLTVNVAALIINVVAAVSSGNVPLNDVQGAIDYKYHVEKLNYHGMLYLPLYSMFLVIDLPTERLFLVQALFQVSFLLTLNFKGISLLQLKNDDPAHADKVKNTFIFNTFVFCQVFNEFNSCKPDELNVFKGISENHLFIGIIAITVVLQVESLE
ncbi:hypothetical protein ZEAMMB73_Zm00001d033107 [Zea mays]|uniref:Cation-transporting P-type ATPase C-terminal domain-containing protein n=1 Tax=Zea mays TaxID=4577 RepID=A0A1D6KWB6_MAIZE|nr:hypothetical protein ZEAMMB73_Zm00001d033107 [Zea mays]